LIRHRSFERSCRSRPKAPQSSDALPAAIIVSSTSRSPFNIEIVERWRHGDAKAIRRGAAELVALNPDVIVSNSTLGAATLKQATQLIPVVAAQFVDPVGVGLVESLSKSKPGGNITGFTYIDFPLVLKGRRC
jgi:ABC-type uncharacterized transport system substrate-binding protein